MEAAVTTLITLKLHTCTCGVTFGLPADLYAQHQRTGGRFRCVTVGCGKTWGWNDTEADRLRRQLESAQRNSTWNRERAEHEQAAKESARRQVSAMKGVVTRTRNRVGNGVCPCCKRTFSQLRRHMHDKHPGYGASESGAAPGAGAAGS